ncbi:hypothetical protein [Cellulomonas sp. 73-145]|uniref:hypothetical protein n=1 Tax=Cellulomonas sp. 73-145 TaxID=1895739 RepID=UPI001AD595B8|nr:hypothetical protein [Cellulomonas sp. 73-145]MBN9328084.1 hypothetical protein [Cellulomonas sp.]
MATRARFELERSWGSAPPVVVDKRSWSWPRTEPDAVKELRRLVDARANLGGQIAVGVQELRAAGASWSVIGHVLGVTRSAAQKRYGRDELLPR